MISAATVSEPFENLGQALVGEQIEEHEHVGLLGDLVAVRRVPLGVEDPVEPLDVAVLLAIAVPVELLQVPRSLRTG
jgi:hypothetical protein